MEFEIHELPGEIDRLRQMIQELELQKKQLVRERIIEGFKVTKKKEKAE